MTKKQKVELALKRISKIPKSRLRLTNQEVKNITALEMFYAKNNTVKYSQHTEYRVLKQVYRGGYEYLATIDLRVYITGNEYSIFNDCVALLDVETGYLFKSAYWVMGIGYRSNGEYNFKLHRDGYYWRSADPGEYDFDNDHKAQVLNKYQKRSAKLICKVLDLKDAINMIRNINKEPIIETAAKEGWSNILNQVYISGNKPIGVLGLDGWPKDRFKKFIKTYGGIKSFNLRLYKDYIDLAKVYKDDFNESDYFAKGYKRLHDEYLNIQRSNREDEEAERDKRLLSDKKTIKSIKRIYQKDINIRLFKNKKDLREFGKFMGNCLSERSISKGDKYYSANIKGVWIAVAKYGNESEDNMSDKHGWEIRGTKNWTPPLKIINAIKNKVNRKEIND